jgi:hypothetical protein
VASRFNTQTNLPAQNWVDFVGRSDRASKPKQTPGTKLGLILSGYNAIALQLLQRQQHLTPLGSA